MKNFAKNQIIYIQGVWKGRVEEDFGSSVRVEPLEGIHPHEKGKLFTYSRVLIKTIKRP
jgi:hypothetical protein